jgi:hypothetical protein
MAEVDEFLNLTIKNMNFSSGSFTIVCQNLREFG